MRHCWVLDPPGTLGKWPGIVLEWRRSDDRGWWGHVAYAVERDGGPVLVVEWLVAAYLAPVEP